MEWLTLALLSQVSKLQRNFDDAPRVNLEVNYSMR